MVRAGPRAAGARIYVNGVPAGTRAVPVPETAGASHSTWTPGARHLNSSPADQHSVGEIDDVKVYNRALSEVEIRRAAGLCS
ncbi:MAG: LamG-like jellyroll fold domain-containing protein [Acidobacteriota bacterium]